MTQTEARDGSTTRIIGGDDTMATIYNAETGSAISEGLQGCETCDEARQAAEQHLREQEYPGGHRAGGR